MTNIRCLATNCMYNSSENENEYGNCNKKEIDITVWEDEKHEHMKCKDYKVEYIHIKGRGYECY